MDTVMTDLLHACVGDGFRPPSHFVDKSLLYGDVPCCKYTTMKTEMC